MSMESPMKKCDNSFLITTNQILTFSRKLPMITQLYSMPKYRQTLTILEGKSPHLFIGFSQQCQTLISPQMISSNNKVFCDLQGITKFQIQWIKEMVHQLQSSLVKLIYLQLRLQKLPKTYQNWPNLYFQLLSMSAILLLTGAIILDQSEAKGNVGHAMLLLP